MFYNTHIHIFKNEDVPTRFLTWPLVPLLRTKIGFSVITGFMQNLWPFSSNDVFDRYVKFVEINEFDSQLAIFEECERFYPKNTHFCALSMDMAYMGAGKVERPFEEQLKELAEVKKKKSQVIPFINADPRRPNILELVKYAVEVLGFKGVKSYPSLGYFPYDTRLDEVYKYCSDNNIPIISHVSPYNPVHFKGKKKELKKMLKYAKLPVDWSDKSKKGLCSNFNNPLNWKIVAEKYPNLKICLAHFGSEYYWKEYMDNPQGDDNWFVYVKEMIEQMPNVYTDVSFTLNNKEFFPMLKILLENENIRNKVMFGSDYYMVETKTSERRFGVELRAYLGADVFKTIAYDVPREYLGIDDDYRFS
jgi:predicted TIM-barrel fold metal-dependent hydrolase